MTAREDETLAAKIARLEDATNAIYYGVLFILFFVTAILCLVILR